jgi:hypothetical protein
MSYRRVARSYRRSVALQYRKLEEHPKAHMGVMIGIVVAVLGVVGGMLISAHSGSTFKASGNAVSLATTCATPTDSTSASTSVAPATSTSAAASPAAVSHRRRRPFPTVSATTSTSAPSDPAVSPTTTAAPSDPAGTSSPSTSAAPSASATSATTAPAPSTSVTSTPCATVTPSASPSTSAPVTVAVNVNCDLIMPASPLSAQGLATAYQLTGTDGATPAASGCEMTNAAALGAFVQATILDPATGALSVYDPLVVTQGTQPAVAPTVPTLPADAVVTIDFGFNGTDLTLVGATARTLQQGNCSNGTQGSIFGQVSFCNGTAFFAAAFQAERRGKLAIPALATSPKTGQPCLTTRSWDVVDQDPSDNVTTEYLLAPSGQTAQDTTSNAGNLAGATMLLNGSDNTLLDLFMDPVLGCTPFQAPDLANNDMPTSSQALDELLAAADQTVSPALIPENDEMVLVDNAFSVAKTDAYRAEIGQAPVSGATQRSSGPAMFCQNMANVQTPFLAANEDLLATGQSPVTAVGNNLFTFLANRLSMSFTNLGCQNFGLVNTVTVTLDGNGVATAATFNTAQQTATNTTSGSPPPGPGRRHGRRHHEYDNPSGM